MNRNIRYNQIQSLGKKKTQQTQSDIKADNTCFQMSTIPKSLHLPLCYPATLFSDSLRVCVNPEIKETGILWFGYGTNIVSSLSYVVP
jgi:hypothetical protein